MLRLIGLLISFVVTSAMQHGKMFDQHLVKSASRSRRSLRWMSLMLMTIWSHTRLFLIGAKLQLAACFKLSFILHTGVDNLTVVHYV